MLQDDEILDLNQDLDDINELDNSDNTDLNKKDKKKKESKKDKNRSNSEDNENNGGKKKKKKGWKVHVRRIAIALVVLVILYFTAVYSNIPFIKEYRTLYIETAMNTMTHQWMARNLLPKSVVDKWRAEKKANEEAQKLLESKWDEVVNNTENETETETEIEEVDPSIEFFETYWELDTPSVRYYLSSNPMVAGDYSSIFIEDPDDELGLRTVNNHHIYAIDQKNNTVIIALHEDKYEAKLALVKDPSQVELKKASRYGRKGDEIAVFGKTYDAVVAINASGFIDKGGHGNGGTVNGCMIINGIDYGKEYNSERKFYGMKYDNKLYIENYWRISPTDYKWGVQFMPALIVNGEKSVEGSFGMGIQPRTAVGQAQDGTFMMLVVDGRQVGYSLGCSVRTCADVLESYGAIQAANFDGGSSAIMWYNGKQITKPSSVSKTGRYLPDALLIMRAGEQ